jgi:hypothetical protein
MRYPEAHMERNNGHADFEHWDRKTASLYRNDKLSTQSISTHNEAQSPSPSTTLGAEKQSELGMRPDPAKKERDDMSKSLYEAFSESSRVAGVLREEPQRLIDEYQRSLFENFSQRLSLEERLQALLDNAQAFREPRAVKEPADYTQPFVDFLTENPTVFHTVDYFERKLEDAGFKKVCLSISWMVFIF